MDGWICIYYGYVFIMDMYSVFKSLISDNS